MYMLVASADTFQFNFFVLTRIFFCFFFVVGRDNAIYSCTLHIYSSQFDTWERQQQQKSTTESERNIYIHTRTQNEKKKLKMKAKKRNNIVHVIHKINITRMRDEMSLIRSNVEDWQFQYTYTKTETNYDEKSSECGEQKGIAYQWTKIFIDEHPKWYVFICWARHIHRLHTADNMKSSI